MSKTVNFSNKTTSVLTTSNTWSNDNTFNDTLAINSILETAQKIAGTASPFTCDMSLGSTFYIPSDYTFASDFKVIITNVPIDTSKEVSISIIYHQALTSFFISTVKVSDTAGNYLLGTVTTFGSPLFNQGVPTLANSPCLIIQTLSIISLASTTDVFIRKIVSSINSFY
jgi:hypothetical protein